ncbi:MAG: DUF6384 family protein [Desulfobacterales bacterium]|jgi:hypothetical protein|nr:DUF6384 family protein [Desulfobacterales bacterium]
MPEPAQSRTFELDEVMLAMDVVDTLRHQRSLVERELQSDDREQALIEKLRKIYADQGLEVSDEVVARGVRAMREERFAYRPPKKGFKTSLAHLYVNRGRWFKGVAVLLVALAAVWAGYRFLYVMPAERGKAELARELGGRASAQQERAAALRGRIESTGKALEKALGMVAESEAPAVGRLAERSRLGLAAAAGRLEAFEKLPPVGGLDAGSVAEKSAVAQRRLGERNGLLDLAQKDLDGAQASVDSILALRDEVAGLSALRAQALKEAREPGAAGRIEALYANAAAAAGAGDIESLRTARQALQYVYDTLRQEYTLQIVSRPGTPSGIWRTPANSRTARNYYLIVEALTASGQRLKLPVTSEEDGKVRTVSEWGLRVDQQVYEQVRRDKEADGIVNRKNVGVKKRGYLTPEYSVSTTGAAITAW